MIALFKTLFPYKSSPPEVFPWKSMFCECNADFQGASVLGVGVVSIKLQDGFSEIVLLHNIFPAGLLHVCEASFSENNSGRLLFTTDSFIYDL